MKKFDEFIRDLDTVEKWDAHISDYDDGTFIFMEGDVKFVLKYCFRANAWQVRGLQKIKNDWFNRYIFRNPHYYLEKMRVHLPYADYAPHLNLATEATSRRQFAKTKKEIAKNMEWLR